MTQRSPTDALIARNGAWLVLIASLAFATSAPLSRLASPAHPLAIAFGRVAIAALVLGLSWGRAGLLEALSRLRWAQRLRAFVAGALLAAHFALFQWGLQQTSLAAAVSLVSLEPLSVVLSAWLFFGVKPHRLEKIGVLTATLGAVVVASGAGEGDHRALGDVLVLGAVVLFGLYVASARGLRDAIEPAHYAPIVYASAALTLAPSLLFLESSAEARIWPLPANALWTILALGLVPTVIGHTLVQAGARTLSPSLVALVCPGETLGSIAIGFLLWRKPPTLIEAVGGLVILAGCLIAIHAQRIQRPTAEL